MDGTQKFCRDPSFTGAGLQTNDWPSAQAESGRRVCVAPFGSRRGHQSPRAMMLPSEATDSEQRDSAFSRFRRTRTNVLPRRSFSRSTRAFPMRMTRERSRMKAWHVRRRSWTKVIRQPTVRCTEHNGPSLRPRRSYLEAGDGESSVLPETGSRCLATRMDGDAGLRSFQTSEGHLTVTRTRRVPVQTAHVGRAASESQRRRRFRSERRPLENPALTARHLPRDCRFPHVEAVVDGSRSAEALLNMWWLLTCSFILLGDISVDAPCQVCKSKVSALHVFFVQVGLVS